VATVKMVDPGPKAGRMLKMEGTNRFIAQNFTVKLLIAAAYDLNPKTISGEPGWANSEHYDIEAVTPGAVRPTHDEQMKMLRALLTERFHLMTHDEERPVAAYAMVAAKTKMKQADAGGRPGCRNAPAPSGTSPIFSLHCQNVTMEQLAEELPAFGGLYVTHPVFDATGLKGGWDFDLSWSPPHLVRGQEPGVPASMAPVAEDPNGALTIVEALSKLGLKLEPRKHPMPVLVVDHVEPKPTDN
jgi:uncharacterized protein (TIGR03435 family)